MCNNDNMPLILTFLTHSHSLTHSYIHIHTYIRTYILSLSYFLFIQSTIYLYLYVNYKLPGYSIEMKAQSLDDHEFPNGPVWQRLHETQAKH